MDFFKLLNAFLNVLASLIILAVAWALYPYFHKLLIVVQTIHTFGQ